MPLTEVTLPKLSTEARYLHDSLRAVCHTLLFLRNPSVVTPMDRSVRNLSVKYTTCDSAVVGDAVERAVAQFTAEMGDQRDVRLVVQFTGREKGWFGYNDHELEKWKMDVEVRRSEVEPSTGDITNAGQARALQNVLTAAVLRFSDTAQPPAKLRVHASFFLVLGGKQVALHSFDMPSQ